MRKRIRYFDMAKIDRNNEPLSPSELEVAQRLSSDPKPDLLLRLDLEAAMNSLPPRQQEAIRLLAAGHKEREIAALLGISQPAVHKLLTKARLNLQKSLG